jgi:hypothetical protein
LFGCDSSPKSWNLEQYISADAELISDAIAECTRTSYVLTMQTSST